METGVLSSLNKEIQSMSIKLDELKHSLRKIQNKCSALSSPTCTENSTIQEPSIVSTPGSMTSYTSNSRSVLNFKPISCEGKKIKTKFEGFVPTPKNMTRYDSNSKLISNAEPSRCKSKRMKTKGEGLVSTPKSLKTSNSNSKSVLNSEPSSCKNMKMKTKGGGLVSTPKSFNSNSESVLNSGEAESIKHNKVKRYLKKVKNECSAPPSPTGTDISANTFCAEVMCGNVQEPCHWGNSKPEAEGSFSTPRRRNSSRTSKSVLTFYNDGKEITRLNESKESLGENRNERVAPPSPCDRETPVIRDSTTITGSIEKPKNFRLDSGLNSFPKSCESYCSESQSFNASSETANLRKFNRNPVAKAVSRAEVKCPLSKTNVVAISRKDNRSGDVSSHKGSGSLHDSKTDDKFSNLRHSMSLKPCQYTYRNPITGEGIDESPNEKNLTRHGIRTYKSSNF